MIEIVEFHPLDNREGNIYKIILILVVIVILLILINMNWENRMRNSIAQIKNWKVM